MHRHSLEEAKQQEFFNHFEYGITHLAHSSSSARSAATHLRANSTLTLPISCALRAREAASLPQLFLHLSGILPPASR